MTPAEVRTRRWIAFWLAHFTAAERAAHDRLVQLYR